jgi:phosphoketolase
MGAPKEVDGKKIADNFLSHQVVFEDVAKNESHLKILEQ